MARDKGKITRFVDRLEKCGFLTKKSDAGDRRLSIIKATSRGRRVAPQLKIRFEEIRNQLFQGIDNGDIKHLETVLSRLYENAECLTREKSSRNPN